MIESYFYEGFDCFFFQRVRHSDRSRFRDCGIPLSQSRLLAATLYCRINPWATFVFEQSQYQTTLTPEAGPLSTIAGTPATKWKDQRSEFGPVFIF